MPFNAELEDFAQAFSSGYAGTKSKEEREAEALTLQINQERLKSEQFANEQAPKNAAQADALHEITMQLRRGEISDAEAARQQRAILDPIAVQQANESLAGTRTTNEFNRLKLEHLPTEQEQADAQAAANLTGTQTQNKLGELELENAPEKYRQQAEEFSARMEVLGLDITAKKYAASRTPIDDAHKDALFQLEQQHAKNVITEDEYKQKRRLIDDAFTDAKNKVDLSNARIQGDVYKQQIEQSAAQTAKLKAETAPLDYANSILEAAKLLGNPLEEPAEAVDPSLPGTGSGRIVPGPQSAVEVPGSTVGTHDDESEGITKGSKNSPTAKTLRKLKNGEIPSMADYIDVGVEASVNAAKSSAKDAGLDKDEAVSTPESELNASNWLSGAHGADAEVAQMVIETVKEGPGGERISPQQEFLITIAKGQLAFSLAGMPERAEAFAKGMQGYAQQLTGQYAAFAKAAAANGDVDGTTMGLMKSYLNIGNGKDLDIRPDPKREGMFIATITNTKTGKVEEEHVVTPEEMIGKAMRVTPGTSMEILNAAAGGKDETISNAAARVLAAEYKDYGLTAEEISDMTTAEFEKVQERLEKDIADRKPEKVTDAEVDAADKEITTALADFKEASPDEYQKLGFGDSTTEMTRHIAPIAAQIKIRSKGKLNGTRALQGAIGIITDGPSELLDLKDGNLLVHVEGINPFIISSDDYFVLTTYRNKFGLPEDRPSIPPGSGGTESAVPAAPAAPATPAPTHEDWRRMEEGIHSPSVPFDPHPFIPTPPPPAPSQPPQRDYYPRG